MTVKLDIPDPFEEPATSSVSLDVPDPFDAPVAPQAQKPIAENKGMTLTEGAHEAYKQVGRLGMGALEGVARAAEGGVQIATQALRPYLKPGPHMLFPGLIGPTAYAPIKGQEDKFENPVEEAVVKTLRKGKLGLKHAADAFRYTRTGTDVEHPEFAPEDTGITASTGYKESMPGKIMNVVEEFSPLAGQMAAAAALGGGPALALEAFSSHLAEGSSEYIRNNPNATESEAINAAAPGAATLGLSFALMGPVTKTTRKVLGKVVPGVFGKTIEGAAKYGAKEATKDLTAALIGDVPYLTAQGIAVGSIDKAMRVRDFRIQDMFTWENQLNNALIVTLFKGMSIPAARRNAKYIKSIQDHLDNTNIPIAERGYLAAQLGVSLSQQGERKLAEQFIKATKAKFTAERNGVDIEAIKAVMEKARPATPFKPVVAQEEIDTELARRLAINPKTKADADLRRKNIEDLKAAIETTRPATPFKPVVAQEELNVALADTIAKNKPAKGKARETRLAATEPTVSETRTPILKTAEGEIIRGEPGMSYEEMGYTPGMEKGWRTAEGDIFAPKIRPSTEKLGIVRATAEPKSETEPKIKIGLPKAAKEGKVKKAGGEKPKIKAASKESIAAWKKEHANDMFKKVQENVATAKTEADFKKIYPNEAGMVRAVAWDEWRKKGTVKFSLSDRASGRNLTDQEIRDLDVMVPAVRTKDGKVISGKVNTYLLDNDIHPALAKKLVDEAAAKKGERGLSERMQELKEAPPEWGFRLSDGKFLNRQEAFDRMVKSEPEVFKAYLADQKKYLYRPYNKDSRYYKWTDAQIVEHMRRKGLESITYLVAKGVTSETADFSREDKMSYYESLAKGEQPELRLEPLTGIEPGKIPKTDYHTDRQAKLKFIQDDITSLVKQETGKTLPADSLVYYPEAPNKETKAVAAMAKELGVDVVYFTNKYKDIPMMGAAIKADDPGTVFINVKSKNPAIELIGHEWGHDLQENHPDMFLQFVTELSPYVKPDISDYWKTRKSYYRLGGDLAVVREFWADAYGRALGKEQFWRKLRIKNPKLFGTIMNSLIDYTAKLKEKLTGGKVAEIEKYFTEFDKVIEAAVKVFDEVATRKQVEKIKPQYDSEGALIAYERSTAKYTKKDIEIMLHLKRRLGDIYLLPPELQKYYGRNKVKVPEQIDYSLEPTIKALKEDAGKYSDAFKDAVKAFVYPPMGVAPSGKQRFGEFKGRQAIMQATFQERVRKIQNKIKGESLDSWIDYNDRLRTGQAIPTQWKEFDAIGEVIGDALFDNIVSVYPEMAPMRRDYHHAITLQWAFEGTESDPFMGLGSGLRGDSSFRKKYSGKTVSELIASGMALKSTDPISTMARTIEAQSKFAASGKMAKDGIESGDYIYIPIGDKVPEGFAPLPPEISEVHKNLLFPPSGYDVRDSSGKKVDFYENKANAEAKAKAIGGTVNPGGGAEFIKSFAVLDSDGLVLAQFPQREMANSFVAKQQVGGLKIETWLGRKTSEISGQWCAPKGEVRLHNNYLSVDKFRRNALGGSLMEAINAIKAIELFSLFHFSTITQEIGATRIGLAIQQALNLDSKGLGRTIKSIDSSLALGPLSKEWLRDPKGFSRNPAVQAQLRRYLGDDAAKFGEVVVDLFNAGILIDQDPTLRWGERKGAVSKYTGVNTTRRSWDILKEGVKDKSGTHMIIGAYRVPIDVIRGLQGLLFRHYIPNAKISIAMMHYLNDLRQYKGQLERGTMTRYQLAKEAVTFTEMRMGEVNWENLGFNKTYKTLLQAVARAPLWKGGTIAAFATSVKRMPRQARHIIDAIKYGERVPVDKDIAWLPGILTAHIMSSMMISYGVAWITGNEDLKPDKLIYFFPKISVAYELATGEKKYRRAAEPGYLTEAIKIGHAIKEDPFHIPIHYFKGGLNSYFGKVGEVYRNRDFFGNQIYDENASFAQRQIDKAIHMAPLPFGVVAYNKAAQMEEGAAKWMLGSGLIQKAPAWVTQSKAEAKMSQYLSERSYGGGFTKEEAKDNELRRALINEIRKGATSFEAFKPETQNAMRKLAPDRLKRIIKSAAKPPIVSGFSKLKLREAEAVWKLMTNEEKIATAGSMARRIEGSFRKYQNDPEKIEIEATRLTPILSEIQSLVPSDMPMEE